MRGAVPVTPFEEIWCLTLFGADGGFVGYFYHPNREAIDLKAKEVAVDIPGLVHVIDRYVRAS